MLEASVSTVLSDENVGSKSDEDEANSSEEIPIVGPRAAALVWSGLSDAARVGPTMLRAAILTFSNRKLSVAWPDNAYIIIQKSVPGWGIGSSADEVTQWTKEYCSKSPLLFPIGSCFGVREDEIPTTILIDLDGRYFLYSPVPDDALYNLANSYSEIVDIGLRRYYPAHSIPGAVSPKYIDSDIRALVNFFEDEVTAANRWFRRSANNHQNQLRPPPHGQLALHPARGTYEILGLAIGDRGGSDMGGSGGVNPSSVFRTSASIFASVAEAVLRFVRSRRRRFVCVGLESASRDSQLFIFCTLACLFRKRDDQSVEGDDSVFVREGPDGERLVPLGRVIRRPDRAARGDRGIPIFLSVPEGGVYGLDVKNSGEFFPLATSIVAFAGLGAVQMWESRRCSRASVFKRCRYRSVNVDVARRLLYESDLE